MSNVELNPFMNKKYSRQLDPLKYWHEIAMEYVSVITGKDSRDDELRALVQTVAKKMMKDPMVKHTARKENGDKFITTTRLLQYIRESQNDGRSIVPSFTTYLPSSKDGGRDSILKGQTAHLLATRKVVKYNASVAKAEKRVGDAINLTNKQKLIKLLANGYSGTYGARGTALFNKSAHYTLTSITRCTASVGNGTTEMVVMGNRFYDSFATTLAHIISTVLWCNRTEWIEMNDKYNLHVPTTDEVIKVIRWSSDLYWESEEDIELLREYIDGIDSMSKMMICYNNDWYHFSRMNEDIARSIMEQIIQVRHKLVPANKAEQFFKDCPEYIDSLARHIVREDLKGFEITYAKMQYEPAFDKLLSSQFIIQSAFKEHSILFSSLFAGDVAPPNIANLKGMLRRAIVLSDTDSTCATYNDCVEWFYGIEAPKTDGTAIAATMMTFAAQAVENNMALFSYNMNVDSDNTSVLKMKNEYYWTSFALTSKTKHYYAAVNIQEGFVFNDPELEVKGGQFIVSNIPLEYREIRDNMFREINDSMSNKTTVDVAKYVQKVVDVENDIIGKIVKGDHTILKTVEIKDPSAYKLDNNKSPYFHHTLWNTVFGPKYGEIPTVPYQAAKYNIELNTKKKLKDFIDSLEDKAMSKRFNDLVSSAGKNGMTSLQLPMEIIVDKGIPTELLDIVDVTKIVRGMCSSLYLILETLGVNIKRDSTLTEMGYGTSIFEPEVTMDSGIDTVLKPLIKI